MMRGLFRTSGVALTLAFLLGLMAIPAGATEHGDDGPAQHCLDHEATYTAPYGKHGTSGDLDVEGVNIAWSGDTVTITNENDSATATVTWCAKGGSGFNEDVNPDDYDTSTYSVISQSIGMQTTVLESGDEFEDSYGTGISYFMLYSVALNAEEPGGEEPGEDEPSVEGCPASTELLVTFDWTGSGYAPDGTANGVTVTGDNNLAFFVGDQRISAIVVTAGDETRHITLDFPETTGSISPHNYEIFGGGTILSLGFCVGPKVNPDSGSGVSVELTKTAECATVNSDGTATVEGSIEVDNHDRRTARITSALDTVLGPGDQALARTTIASLVGMVLAADEIVTVDYAVTFDPMDLADFDNFIEVTIERADNGAARHKIYNDRAAFELCEQPPQPEDEVGELVVLKYFCEAEAAGVEFFVNDPEAPVAGCEEGDATFTLNPGEVTLVVEDGTGGATLEAGTYSLEETDPNLGSSGPFEVVADGETVVVVINFFVEDQQSGGPGPSDGEEEEEEEQEAPREDTQGGTLPDTAVVPMTGHGPAALLALLMLAGLGATGHAMVAEARRRR